MYINVPELVSVDSAHDDDIFYMDITVNSEKSRHTTCTTHSNCTARSAVSRLTTRSTPTVKIGGYDGSLKAQPRKAIAWTPPEEVIVETAADCNI